MSKKNKVWKDVKVGDDVYCFCDDVLEINQVKRIVKMRKDELEIYVDNKRGVIMTYLADKNDYCIEHHPIYCCKEKAISILGDEIEICKKVQAEINIKLGIVWDTLKKLI